MNERISKFALISLIVAGSSGIGRLSASSEPIAESPINIGTRVEMFVDDRLIEPTMRRDVSLELQNPVRREVVLTTDKPWEGIFSAYYTIFQDGPRFRLYYRGSGPVGDNSEQQFTCYAESTDGIHFVRPNLGIHEFNGSKENNIVHTGIESHNFAPFLDTNPAAKPDERYKALAGLSSTLFAYGSSDGIHWKKLQDGPVMTKGTFDSLNIAFWDSEAKCYRSYSRYFDKGGYKGFRAIQHCKSQDFLHWSDPKPNHYADGVPMEHFYTNATFPCPGAPNHYLSFPMRFMPQRKKIAEMKEPGVSDAVFMSSRDGEHWDRSHLGAWLRPGTDQRNWTHRSNMPAWGIVQTGPDEFSMYVSEHYGWPDNRLRRVTVRRHGFSSIHAESGGGDFTTRVLTFSGDRLALNYATSAVGSVKVELQDEKGKPLPGFALADMAPLYGDELDAVLKWKSVSGLPFSSCSSTFTEPTAVKVELQDEKGKPLPGFALADMAPLYGDELDAVLKWKSVADLSEFAGKPVRIRFVLKDADLFSIQTANSATKIQASTK